jgi:hypothetical protein
MFQINNGVVLYRETIFSRHKDVSVLARIFIAKMIDDCEIAKIYERFGIVYGCVKVIVSSC